MFKESTVWGITKAAFDAKAKPECNACPVEAAVLLTKPTGLKVVTPLNKAELEHPAKGLKRHLGSKASWRSILNETSPKAEVLPD